MNFFYFWFGHLSLSFHFGEEVTPSPEPEQTRGPLLKSVLDVDLLLAIVPHPVTVAMKPRYSLLPISGRQIGNVRVG